MGPPPRRRGKRRAPSTSKSRSSPGSSRLKKRKGEESRKNLSWSLSRSSYGRHTVQRREREETRRRHQIQRRNPFFFFSVHRYNICFCSGNILARKCQVHVWSGWCKQVITYEMKCAQCACGRVVLLPPSPTTNVRVVMDSGKHIKKKLLHVLLPFLLPSFLFLPPPSPSSERTISLRGRRRRPSSPSLSSSSSSSSWQ